MQNTDRHGSAKGRILLAEDDLIGQMATAKVLQQAGFEVDVVGDGQQVIGALELLDYDLVVMDCSMPVMDGFSATRVIRSSQSRVINHTVPVVALTGLTLQGDRQKCMEAGMDDYVSKPVDASLLIAAIDRCLGKATRQAELSSPPDEIHTQPAWDAGFLDKLIDKFLQEVPGIIADLQQALGCGDIDGLQAISHRLRGSADLLEASSLSNRANAVEQAGRAGNLELAGRHTPQLINELRKLTASLSEEQERS